MSAEPTYAESMRSAYEEAREEGLRIKGREKLADYWLAKVDWFSDRLARTAQIEADLEAMRVPVPTPLAEASHTLMRIVEDCQGQYELHG
jgi:hypothetical protein